MQVNYQYEVSFLYSFKVLEKVKTEQKQYAPDCLIWGHKYTGNKEQYYIHIYIYISSTYLLNS